MKTIEIEEFKKAKQIIEQCIGSMIAVAHKVKDRGSQRFIIGEIKAAQHQLTKLKPSNDSSSI